MTRLLVLSACLALVAFAGASDPCRNVVCPRRSEIVCPPCEKVFKRANADPANGICCKEFDCKPDPDQPCCGVTCLTEEEELTACNTIFPDNPTLNSLQPEFGTYTVDLRRPAKPERGKCCPKYQCVQDVEALCANRTANQPCPNEADCGLCQVSQIVELANPERGRCCPEFVCVEDAQCLCNRRLNATNADDCPVPSCDPLEDLTLVEPANPDANDCCPQYTCEKNRTRICEATLAFENYTGPACPSCEVPLILREPNFDRGRCKADFVCVPDLTDLCCGFNISTCPGVPECGEFEYANLTRAADPTDLRCCDEYRCFKNFTAVCEALTCPFTTAEGFQLANCPNPNNRNWYYVEVRQSMDIENGVCCPTYKCRETTEKKIYDLEQQASSRRRRRRRS